MVCSSSDRPIRLSVFSIYSQTFYNLGKAEYLTRGSDLKKTVKVKTFKSQYLIPLHASLNNIFESGFPHILSIIANIVD